MSSDAGGSSSETIVFGVLATALAIATLVVAYFQLRKTDRSDDIEMASSPPATTPNGTSIAVRPTPSIEGVPHAQGT